MLDDGKRLIEMMEQAAPMLIRLRLPEANGVIFERAPFHQQEITIGRFETAAQLQPSKTGRRRDKWARLTHGRFKSRFLPRPHIEDRRFAYHARARSGPRAPAPRRLSAARPP